MMKMAKVLDPFQNQVFRKAAMNLTHTICGLSSPTLPRKLERSLREFIQKRAWTDTKTDENVKASTLTKKLLEGSSSWGVRELLLLWIVGHGDSLGGLHACVMNISQRSTKYWL
nr:hypothetical protein Iba_chr11bCG15080 [Ipomoea batatas]GMD54512.1 hypothetical protein Iba_chr11cCG12850 [Ipomoea batatas]